MHATICAHALRCATDLALWMHVNRRVVTNPMQGHSLATQPSPASPLHRRRPRLRSLPCLRRCVFTWFHPWPTTEPSASGLRFLVKSLISTQLSRLGMSVPTVMEAWS